jgi:hypothetical protein
MEPKPGARASRRRATKARVLVHVIIVLVLPKRIVQLLRARCASAAWHCAERNVFAGQRAVLPYGTATARGAPTEEYTREDAEQDDDACCAEDPSLVRDEGRHVGEPALVSCGYHRPTRSGTAVIKCRLIRFALSLAMIPRKMFCRLWMYLRRGAGMLTPWWAICIWEGREDFFEEGQFIFAYDGRVDR